MSRTRRGDRTEVLYLTSAPSPDQFRAMQEALKPDAQAVTYGMAEASFKFHTLLQRGMLANGCRVHTLVGRSATPLFYRGGWWSGVRQAPAEGHTIDHLAFPNVRVLKQVWLAASLALHALRWRARTRGAAHRVLVADAAYITALPAVLRVLAGGGITRVGIVADLYSYMAEVEDAGTRSGGRARDAMRRFAANTYAHLDAFVLLTEHMNAAVNRAGKPHLVMEGVVDSGMEHAPNTLAAKSPHPRFLYAGALRREYGVADLVDGFLALERRDVELHVYGGGDYAPELERAAQADPRLTFHGMAPLATVVDRETEAWVLVNPRPASAEFTKYSFPSKNMEYLASGTAVLTTRLPGMPQDYYPHVRTIDADGPEAVTRAMAAALEVPLEELHERGLAARDFVLRHKNERAQAARILDMAKGATP